MLFVHRGEKLMQKTPVKYYVKGVLESPLPERSLTYAYVLANLNPKAYPSMY